MLSLQVDFLDVNPWLISAQSLTLKAFANASVFGVRLWAAFGGGVSYWRNNFKGALAAEVLPDRSTAFTVKVLSVLLFP